MEFHSLTRRELQSLCKRNKIPANMTNIAMADALKSLEIVEGIEEISQPKESESAQSSIESPAKSEVTSPYVPPTSGRTTRQRTIVKEEPQTSQPKTRTRGTARKTQAKNKEESRADATETPAVAAQPLRRRVPVASACRKMESQLKECAEEDEKKGVPLTPVALEVTSWRRGLKKESEVRRVYSTRRSARLAEKNVDILSEVENEKPEILRNGLFMKEEGENMEMDVKEVSDGVHEVSEITGVEVETSLEENFKKMDGTEVSSGKKQDISDEYDESKLESNVEEKLCQKSETDDPYLEMDQCIDAGDEQLSVHCETGSELDGERADETEPYNGENVAMTLQDSSVEEILSQHSETDEPNPEMDQCIDAGVEQSSVIYETVSELNGERADEREPSNGGKPNENNDFEDGDDYVKQDEVGEENETNPTNGVDNGVKQSSEEELLGKTLCRDIENPEEKIPENVLANINCQLNCSESAAVDSPLHLNADFLEINVEKRQDEVGDEKESNPTKDTECGVQESSSIKDSPIKHFGDLEESAATVHSPMHQIADFLEEIKTSGIEAEPGISIPPGFTETDSSFTIQLKSLTPIKKSASKASATMKKIADVSDNKENIGNCGSKVVFTKETVKIAKDIAENVNKNMDLSDLSMRKLSKMLKEKLQITNKSSKDENGNKAITRPALQALPENKLSNETES